MRTTLAKIYTGQRPDSVPATPGKSKGWIGVGDWGFHAVQLPGQPLPAVVTDGVAWSAPSRGQRGALNPWCAASRPGSHSSSRSKQSQKTSREHHERQTYSWIAEVPNHERHAATAQRFMRNKPHECQLTDVQEYNLVGPCELSRPVEVVKEQLLREVSEPASQFWAGDPDVQKMRERTASMRMRTRELVKRAEAVDVQYVQEFFRKNALHVTSYPIANGSGCCTGRDPIPAVEGLASGKGSHNRPLYVKGRSAETPRQERRCHAQVNMNMQKESKDLENKDNAVTQPISRTSSIASTCHGQVCPQETIQAHVTSCPDRNLDSKSSSLDRAAVKIQRCFRKRTCNITPAESTKTTEQQLLETTRIFAVGKSERVGAVIMFKNIELEDLRVQVSLVRSDQPLNFSIQHEHIPDLLAYCRGRKKNSLGLPQKSRSWNSEKAHICIIDALQIAVSRHGELCIWIPGWDDFLENKRSQLEEAEQATVQHCRVFGDMFNLHGNV